MKTHAILLLIISLLCLQSSAQPCLPPQITCPADITLCQNAAGGYSNYLYYAESIASPATVTHFDREITYTGVSINGGGNSATVLPGSSVSLAYSLSVFFPFDGYCPGCVVQSSIGIGSTFQTLQCEASIYSGYSASYTSGNFTAPSTPGIYYLTQEVSLDFFCQEFKFNNDPARAIGVLIVGPPSPSATDGCPPVVFTNDAPGIFPIGTTNVTWTATDDQNNISQCVQQVTVTAATIYYRDRDGDGHGDPFSPAYACSQPTGFLLNHDDCNDGASGFGIYAGNGCSFPAGASLNFDGVDDEVDFPGSYPAYTSNSLTIEAWINASSSGYGTDRDIVSWEDVDASVEFRLRPTGILQFLVYDGLDVQVVEGTTDLNTDTWTHVAVVKNGNNVTLYVNGVQEATGTISITFTPTQFYIGRGGFTKYFM